VSECPQPDRGQPRDGAAIFRLRLHGPAMSATALPGHMGSRWTAGATLWLLWMIAMWAASFVLLLTDKLAGLWSAIRDLPLLVEVALWLPFLPWMLGTAVWTSSWSSWLRLLLVLCFVLGWTLVSIPRRKPAANGRAEDANAECLS
jgi:hypothetical protein